MARGQSGGDQPVPPTAAAGRSLGGAVLHWVRDIADAMIVARLFEAMLDLGVVVVATSNRLPDDLQGPATASPFIDLLKAFGGGIDATDYALDRLHLRHPGGRRGDGPSRRSFAALTDGLPAWSPTSPTRAAPSWCCGRSPASPRFADLPGGARPGDYPAIADRFHTVVIDGCPASTKRAALLPLHALIDNALRPQGQGGGQRRRRQPT